MSEFANGLDHTWWLYILPNGDVLVAKSNANARHDAGSGLTAGQWISTGREAANRQRIKCGYLPSSHGALPAAPQDIPTGFSSAKGKALGPPVGVAVDHAGALLAADVMGNEVRRDVPDGASASCAMR